MDAREQMLGVFRRFGGTLYGIHRNGTRFRFKAGINQTGDLYVIIFLGKSTRQHHALPLDDWSMWVDEYITLEN